MMQPSGWRVTRLADVCSPRREAAQPTDNPSTRYVGLEHLDSGDSRLSRWGTASEVSSSKSKFYPNDTLYGKLRPYLDKSVLADFPGICSTDIVVIQPCETVSPEFLVHLTHTAEFLEYATKTTQGVNHPRTSWNSLADFEFALPPLPEQRAIARVLRAVQGAKEARERELALERERKAALMENLFTHGTRGESTKQTDIGEVPEKWQVVRLGELCKSSAFGPRFSGDFYAANGNVAILRTTDIEGDGKISYSTMPQAQLNLDKFRQHLLKSNDLVVTRSGTVGIAAVFESFQLPVLPGAFLIRLSLGERIHPGYLSFYINSAYGRERIRKLGAGAIQQNISGTVLRTFQVPVPPRDEQFEIALLVDNCARAEAALDHELILLDELFQALLEELMTGRLSVLLLA
jgi:type I restriction enzyme S subunit